MNFNIVLLLIIGGLMSCVFFGQILALVKELLINRSQQVADLNFAQRYIYIHDEVDCFDKKRVLKEELLIECRKLIEKKQEQKMQTKAKLVSIDGLANKKQ